jgi:hypothetical protein
LQSCHLTYFIYSSYYITILLRVYIIYQCPPQFPFVVLSCVPFSHYPFNTVYFILTCITTFQLPFGSAFIKNKRSIVSKKIGLSRSTIRSFQKRNFTQSTKCCSLNLALTAPTAQATIFRQNPADWQHWPLDNSNN